MNFNRNKPTLNITVSCVGDSIHAAVHSSSFHRRPAQKWSLLKYFLHTLRTLIHGCLAIPGALVFHMVALTSQFEGRTRCTVGAALKMSPAHDLLFYCHLQFFRPNRNCNRLSCSHFNCYVLSINLCVTESHIPTHIIECALHLQMLCCAYWKHILWFGSVILLLLYRWCLWSATSES